MHIIPHTCLLVLLTADVLTATLTSSKLPKAGAKIKYTVVLKNGKKAFNASSKSLTLNTTPPLATSDKSIFCRDGSGAANNFTMNEGTASIIPLAVAVEANITCTFTVTATTAHQQAGQVGAFDMQGVFSGSDLGMYIPTVSAPAIPVYTGIQLEVSRPTIGLPYIMRE